MSEFEVPVLIVGAGPVGLLGAHLLGRQGLGVLLAEKFAERLPAPKAHAVNPRTLEICAAAGLPMQAFLDRATRTNEGKQVRFVTTLTGAQFGVLPYERQGDAAQALTPWPLINIAQPDFEAVIEAEVARHPSVTVRRRLEWLGCEHLADAVLSTLKDLETGETVKVRSRWLIGADGAGSAVREGLGVSMSGPEGLASMMMIHFEADLRDRLKDRPAVLYFLFGADLGAAFIAFDMGKTWVLMQPCGRSETPDDFPPERCRALIEASAGCAVPDLVVRGARGWVMNAQIARKYRMGRAFLAGDAAHRFPPTGGMGLNSGAGDIDDLCWRILAVEQGWADPEILDAYERERRPVAQTNAGYSLANAFRMGMVAGALGPVLGAADREAAAAQRLADPAGRAAIEAAVQAQTEHFDSIRLQLGFRYGDAALDADAPISRFTPMAIPGCRLPHGWLADGRSTLDLIEPGVITALVCSGGAPITTGGRAPLKVLREGADFVLAEGELAAAPGFAVTPGTTLLVRPDGHILAVVDDPGADLALVVEAALPLARPSKAVV